MHPRRPISERTRPARAARVFGLAALATLLATALVVSGCGGNGKDKKVSKEDKKTDTSVQKGSEQITKKMSTSEVLGVDTQFKKFFDLVKAADLDKTVNNEELTLFVPNSEAFDALDDGVLDELAKDPQALASYLKQYMAKGTETLNDLANKLGSELETLAETKLKVGETEDHKITVNDAPLIKYDIATSNATVHVMSQAFAP